MEIAVPVGNDDADHAVCGESGLCGGGDPGRISCDEEDHRGGGYPVVYPVRA